MVALQALTEYGAKYLNVNVNGNLTMFVSRSVNGTRVTGDLLSSFSVNNQNSLSRQNFDLPRVTSVQVQGRGEGCIRFQVNIKTITIRIRILYHIILSIALKEMRIVYYIHFDFFQSRN